PFTHSLVIFAAAFLLATMLRRRPPLPMLAWGLHVLVDIPGHQRFLTPFLYPLSDVRFYGLWEWLSWPMLLVNYAAIVTAVFLLWRRRRLREQADDLAMAPLP